MSPRQDQITALRRLLSRGPASGKSLAQALGLTQSAFSRLWPQTGPDIVSIGAARATQYALMRPIRELGSTLPIYRITEQGQQVLFGELTALVKDQYVFTWNAGPKSKTQWFIGLPYFLQDLRPQGFLGALIPHENATLQLPEKINQWNDDDVLYYLARRGEDVIGNLIVGNESANRFHTHARSRQGLIPERARIARYPTLADEANAGHVGNSSAGGDQPKFLACVAREGEPAEAQRVEHVIVKFSPKLESASARRWGDLIICEHLALSTLRRHGIPACQSQIVEAGSRVFLEVVRFDRVGQQGRLPMVSILGLDGELGTAAESWTYAATMLCKEKKLSEDDLERIRLLDLFGSLIGNSDRHQGNLSLAWTLQNSLALLPSYDMLPMLYRPNSQGEIVEQTFSMSVLDKLDLRHLAGALSMAKEVLNLVLEDDRISKDFKEITSRHLKTISQYEP
ncbi:type II toxin-antitoxin system HipA family toxin YjjJ [soil metagenome]